jgi:hypothetical protein
MSMTDVVYFQCAKCEAVRFAFNYGSKKNKYDVFSKNEYDAIIRHYKKFIKVVIDATTKTLLCSHEVQRLVNEMYGGGRALRNFFLSNPNKLFSCSRDKLELACHQSIFSATGHGEFKSKNPNAQQHIIKNFIQRTKEMLPPPPRNKMTAPMKSKGGMSKGDNCVNKCCMKIENEQPTQTDDKQNLSENSKGQA